VGEGKTGGPRALLVHHSGHRDRFSVAFHWQMSRSERMRHAYLHVDHHLRQFGA
jgi:hypothetical protein